MNLSDRPITIDGVRWFKNTMRIVALFIFLLLAAGYVWSSARSLRQETPAKKVEMSAAELVRAKALFGGKCARCHAPDGRGQTVLGKMLGVPNFTNEKWWKDHGNDDDLKELIRNGNGDMPAFGKKLTKPEIALLADYVRHFNQPEH